MRGCDSLGRIVKIERIGLVVCVCVPVMGSYLQY